jgi:hypothetical protein
VWRDLGLYSSNEPVVLRVKLSAPLALFIAGGLCLLLWFFLHENGKLFLVLGGVIWVGAYVCVLADNYRRRAPVHTRGGLLRYENNPQRYRLVYGFMLFLGLFVLFVFLVLNIFGMR